MIIVHAHSPRHFTHSTSLTCLHYYLKGNMTWFLGSRQAQQISKDSKNRRSGAPSQALANQTCAAESINITTSKIRAGVRLVCATVQTQSTQHSFLWQIMCLPLQITGNRVYHDYILLQLFWLEPCYKSNFCVMKCGSLEFKWGLIELIMKKRNVWQLLNDTQDKTQTWVAAEATQKHKKENEKHN